MSAIFTAVREAGQWRAGRWFVAETERCTHKHRDEESAVRCLRTWSDGRYFQVTAEWELGSFGRVMRCSGLAEEVVREVRPDRFIERRFRYERVTCVWRRWRTEHPAEGHPVEIEMACGAWSMETTGNEKVTPTMVQGIAIGLHLLLGCGMTAEELAVVLQGARRPSPAESERADADGSGVLIMGPWRVKP